MMVAVIIGWWSGGRYIRGVAAAMRVIVMVMVMVMDMAMVMVMVMAMAMVMVHHHHHLNVGGVIVVMGTPGWRRQ